MRTGHRARFSLALGLTLGAALLLSPPASTTSRTATSSSPEAHPMKVHALRLHPGQDLKLELQNYVVAHGIEAGFVLTCVGSLEHTVLRLADKQALTPLSGKREIVSLVGTLSSHGSHLHLSVSDGEGQTLGGHLADGSLVYTTAEIVIGEASDLSFRREQDPETGFKELSIQPR